MIPGELPELLFDRRLRRKSRTAPGVHFIDGVAQLSSTKRGSLGHRQETLTSLWVTLSRVRRCGLPVRIPLDGRQRSAWFIVSRRFLVRHISYLHFTTITRTATNRPTVCPASRKRPTAVFPEDQPIPEEAVRVLWNLDEVDTRDCMTRLVARLFGSKKPEIQALVARAGEVRGLPWFRPLNLSLTPPGGPLVRTLEGHSIDHA